MLRKGVLVRDVPRNPMSPATVRVHLNRVKRCLKVVKVLGPDDQVLVLSREIRPEQLTSYFDKAFPKGPRGQENKWSGEAVALRKLAEWLHFDAGWRGNPVFSKAELKQIRMDIYQVSIPKPKKAKLTEEFLDRYEFKFLPWLRDTKPFLWAPAAFMFFTGLRIHEVAGIDVGLQTGSMILLDNGNVNVRGKGTHGEIRDDELPLTDRAELHLKEWARVRKKLHVDGPVLFSNTRGGRLQVEGAFNRALRLAAKRSNLFTGDVDYNGNHATGELKILHAHSIGRAAFITRMTHDNINPLKGMKLSRHRKIEVYQGYDRSEAEAAVKDVNEAARLRLNGNGTSSDQEETGSLKDMIISAIRDLPPEEKKDLGRALLQELMT